jgi:hypothetical protein
VHTAPEHVASHPNVAAPSRSKKPAVHGPRPQTPLVHVPAAFKGAGQLAHGSAGGLGWHAAQAAANTANAMILFTRNVYRSARGAVKGASASIRGGAKTFIAPELRWPYVPNLDRQAP